jgi:ethanolamine kinase
MFVRIPNCSSDASPADRDPAVFRADALAVCRALLPSWSGVSDARLEPIAGGITNALHKVVPETADREGGPEPVVLRVFGRGTERFLDRETETAALAELNAFGFGAACLGVFNNGRLEAFLADARPVTIEEMATPSVARAVAQTLRRLHACDVRARRGVVA